MLIFLDNCIDFFFRFGLKLLTLKSLYMKMLLLPHIFCYCGKRKGFCSAANQNSHLLILDVEMAY